MATVQGAYVKVVQCRKVHDLVQVMGMGRISRSQVPRLRASNAERGNRSRRQTANGVAKRCGRPAGPPVRSTKATVPAGSLKPPARGREAGDLRQPRRLEGGGERAASHLATMPGGLPLPSRTTNARRRQSHGRRMTEDGRPSTETKCLRQHSMRTRQLQGWKNE